VLADQPWRDAHCGREARRPGGRAVGPPVRAAGRGVRPSSTGPRPAGREEAEAGPGAGRERKRQERLQQLHDTARPTPASTSELLDERSRGEKPPGKARTNPDCRINLRRPAVPAVRRSNGAQPASTEHASSPRCTNTATVYHVSIPPAGSPPHEIPPMCRTVCLLRCCSCRHRPRREAVDFQPRVRPIRRPVLPVARPR